MHVNLQYNGLLKASDFSKILDVVSKCTNLKHIYLLFADTQFQDENLEELISFLKEQNKLEKLEIGLSKTQIQAETTIKLFKIIPNFKVFFIIKCE